MEYHTHLCIISRATLGPKICVQYAPILQFLASERDSHCGVITVPLHCNKQVVNCQVAAVRLTVTDRQWPCTAIVSASGGGVRGRRCWIPKHDRNGAAVYGTFTQVKVPSTSPRLSATIICGSGTNSNWQVTAAPQEPRQPHHDLTINRPRTSSGLCGSCNLISGGRQP